MECIKKDSPLWMYLSEYQRGLLLDGEELCNHVSHISDNISDYSFLVFPFAKAYEGFLKQFLLDLDFIQEDEYYGDDIRIGRIMNPHYLKNNRNSLFDRMCNYKNGGEALAKRIWNVWRRGRNEVFHYFPHNFRKLTYNEALEIIKEIIEVMNLLVVKCDLDTSNPKSANLTEKVLTIK
ncbi:MAG: hypothetical protein R3B92_01380 [Patescibacteria group bacterium]|uniref:Bacterial toxin RNase RnlA/LsoA DBD domain-containing protein n=1 Tax=candidate division WWE3 bacterium TaxID=2053526 RepID=A0A955ECC1_UNCKA|nr:hypothetical protein [candidate division WWE3 bacterium]